MTLKVLSWNIWFYGNLKKVNEFLENCNADIIGLQEVMMGDKKIQISTRLTEELGYKYVYAPAFQYPINGIPTTIGNAILSRYPILSSKIHTLSENEKRVAIQADIQIGNNTFHIFNTHLLHTHQQPSEVQELEATNLVNVLTPKKTVLMGDFNALPESNAIQIISKKMKNTDSNLLPTWSIYPQGCEGCLPKGILYKLDNIFISADIKNSSFKVEKSKASDHLPVSTLLEI